MATKQTPVKKKVTKTKVSAKPIAKQKASTKSEAKAKAPVAKATAKASAKKLQTTKATAEPRRVTKDTLTKGYSRQRFLRKPPVVTGFVEFLREQSVVGLAIGLVIGAQVKALADQLIASFINPLLGLVLPGTGSLDKKVFVLHLGDKAAKFAWGSFAAVMLSFITTALVIYFVFKALKLDKLAKKKS